MIQATVSNQPFAEAEAIRNKRGSSRFHISLPLSIRYQPPHKDSGEFSGETINISGRGFYLVTDTAFPPGTRLSLTVTMHDKKSSPAPIVARARVRVVRSEAIWHRGVRRFGVAAEIEYYSV